MAPQNEHENDKHLLCMAAISIFFASLQATWCSLVDGAIYLWVLHHIAANFSLW